MTLVVIDDVVDLDVETIVVSALEVVRSVVVIALKNNRQLGINPIVQFGLPYKYQAMTT